MLLQGDCLEVMKNIDACSVDSIVTDPPYGLKFMSKEWDHGVPGVPFWEAALRVAKPGAHLLAFGGTRTFHRLAVAIEDAGWEIRDCVMWVYSQGFPKSHNVSKAIDKAAGAERPIVGKHTLKGNGAVSWKEKEGGTYIAGYSLTGVKEIDITSPATEAAKQWDGWGTALKPAWEPVIVARKPFKGTVANNVLEHGTGAINVDGCRVATSDKRSAEVRPNPTESNPLGRWPANLILTYPEDEFILRDDVTPNQLHQLAEWMK